ncbi:MAG: peptidase C39 family protein [Nitrospirae bacterium]|nr:peptidase C39 family protein [Nitrospirota bacterium]
MTTIIISLLKAWIKSLISQPHKKDAFFRRHPFVLFLVLSLLLSCAAGRDIRQSADDRVISNVPFYPQEDYQCGPSSLAAILNYRGLNVTPHEIAEEVYSKSARGTLNMDMILYAERKGFKADQYEGSIEDIKKNIDAGNPLIVMVDYGIWVYQKNHFMVVTGYNENGITANSGKERRKFIPLNNFLRSWERTKFWTLLITPK